MNPETTTSQVPTPVKIVLPAKRRHIPNLFGWLFALLVIFVLAALLIPFSSTNCARSPQTRALAQAKQIGLALRLFAGDHDGHYPGKGFPAEMTRAPATSNAAFACLFPTYVTAETIFGNKLSAYQTRLPDNGIDAPYTGTPIKTLEAGENVYAYVAGLKDGDDTNNANVPIVMDGTDGTLFYNSTRSMRGGVWEGKGAVVVYLDNSAAFQTLKGRENTRYIPVHLPGRPENLLDLSWLGNDVYLLNPAVAP